MLSSTTIITVAFWRSYKYISWSCKLINARTTNWIESLQNICPQFSVAYSMCACIDEHNHHSLFIIIHEKIHPWWEVLPIGTRWHQLWRCQSRGFDFVTTTLIFIV